jgi:hypothetical protein
VRELKLIAASSELVQARPETSLDKQAVTSNWSRWIYGCPTSSAPVYKASVGQGSSMPRSLRDNNLETRTARLRLEARGKPYWRLIQTGLHVGYRRLRRRGGTWIARRFVGSGRYVELSLGTADDFQEKDGTAVLDFGAAQHAAPRMVPSRAPEGAGNRAPAQGALHGSRCTRRLPEGLPPAGR